VLRKQSRSLHLEIASLRLSFPDAKRESRLVLDLGDFSVARGAQLAICGPSGSGKTTLLNVLAGLQKPQRGKVRWSNVELNLMSQPALDRWRRENVGMVFQHFHLFSRMSPFENVLLPRRFSRWSIDASFKLRAYELLDRLKIRPHGDVDTLSRGEMQRVAVARALLGTPTIVLADEPTASLDIDTGMRIGDLLQSLCREARATLIIATHDRALADRLDEIYEIVDHGLWPQVRGRAASLMTEPA